MHSQLVFKTEEIQTLYLKHLDDVLSNLSSMSKNKIRDNLENLKDIIYRYK